jgi:3-hydroxyisobutyrate dehydrogenase-like beta-hydroxyacid dehydrogenase
MTSMATLCAASDLVISAVTASSTLAVAQEAARHIRAGAVFLDLNSASPGTKQQAAAADRSGRRDCTWKPAS